MAAAIEEYAGFQIGMVAVVQTFGALLNIHPHVHALATRGGWDRSGTWLAVPYLDERAAERLFRHKVLRLLRDAGLLGAGHTPQSRFAGPRDGRHGRRHASRQLDTRGEARSQFL